MLHLAHVPRPGVLEQRLHCVRRELQLGLAVPLGLPSQEVVGQNRDVLAAVTQRRQANLDGV